MIGQAYAVWDWMASYFDIFFPNLRRALLIVIIIIATVLVGTVTTEQVFGAVYSLTGAHVRIQVATASLSIGDMTSIFTCIVIVLSNVVFAAVSWTHEVERVKLSERRIELLEGWVRDNRSLPTDMAIYKEKFVTHELWARDLKENTLLGIGSLQASRDEQGRCIAQHSAEIKALMGRSN